jgi:hypothetical protein
MVRMSADDTQRARRLSAAPYDGRHTLFVEELFPLIIAIGPKLGHDEATIEHMDAAYEAYWARGERYSLISISPRNAPQPNARARKLIVDWASRPRVKEMSAKYCVGSASVVASAFLRGALTAILWLWTPASPHLAAGTHEEAIDYCLAQMEKAKLVLPRPAAEIRARALAIMDSA